MSIQFFPNFNVRFYDSNGNALAFGKVRIYYAGTTNPATTYNFANNANPFPIVLDANGECELKGDQGVSYDIYTFTATEFTQRTFPSVSIPSAVSGGGGTDNHDELINREMNNQHPTSAITGLDESLADKVSKSASPNAEQVVSGGLLMTNGTGSFIGSIVNTIKSLLYAQFQGNINSSESNALNVSSTLYFNTGEPSSVIDIAEESKSTRIQTATQYGFTNTLKDEVNGTFSERLQVSPNGDRKVQTYLSNTIASVELNDTSNGEVVRLNQESGNNYALVEDNTGSAKLTPTDLTFSDVSIFTTFLSAVSATLQKAYDTGAQIITSVAKGAVKLTRTLNSDTHTVLQIGDTTASDQATLVVGDTKTASLSSHAFTDKTQWQPTDGTGKGHASYDAKATSGGTTDKDHMVSFQSRLNHPAGVGTLTYLWGAKNEDTINGAVTNHIGYSVKAPFGTGIIQNEYGFTCEDLVRGVVERIQLYLAGTGSTYAIKSEGINLFTKSGNALSSAVQIRSGRPSILLEETDQALDQKFWDFTINGGLLVLRTMQDDMGNAKTWLQFNRSGNDITSLNVNTRIVSSASTTTRAGFNVPHSTLTITPANGDIETSTAGLFARINGVTEKMTPVGYGEIHVHDSAVAQSIPTGTTYALITNWTDNGESLYTTPDAVTNKRITVAKAGVYQVVYNCSMISGTNNATFLVTAYKNGTTELNNLHFSRKIGTGADVGSAGFSGLVSLSANDYIDVRVRHDQIGAVNFTQVYACLSLQRIG
jgi:hypothetical protein